MAALHRPLRPLFETVTKLFDQMKTDPCATSELATNPLSQVTKNGLTRFSGRLWHASRWRRERISIWTSEQRQELGDEVIVANVRELRAISHVHRKSDQVEADGMDEEQATTKARETESSRTTVKAV